MHLALVEQEELLIKTGKGLPACTPSNTAGEKVKAFVELRGLGTKKVNDMCVTFHRCSGTAFLLGYRSQRCSRRLS